MTHDAPLSSDTAVSLPDTISRKTYARAVVGVCCAIEAEELLGYGVIDSTPMILGHSLTAFFLLMVIQLAVAIFLFIAFGREVPARLLSGRALPTILAAAGGLAVLTGLSGDASTWACIALLVLGAGAFFVKYAAVCILVDLGDKTRNMIVFIAVSAQVLISPVCYLPAFILPLIAAIMIAVGAFALCPSKQQTSLPISEGKEYSYTNRLGSSIGKVIAGVIVMSVCCSFFSSLPAIDTLPVGDAAAYTWITHLIAALLLGAFVITLNDESFTFVFRAVFTLLIISFGIVPVFGAGSVVPAFFSTVGYSLYEGALVLAVAKFIALGGGSRLRVFCLYRILLCVSSITGMILWWVNAELMPVTSSYSIIATMLLVVLAVVGLWIVTERELNDFFWGQQTTMQNTGESAETDGDADEPSMETLGNRFGLSARELDVFKLMAEGRSAPFIAETLFLSENTVRKHVSSVYRKCGVHSKQEFLSVVHKDR